VWAASGPSRACQACQRRSRSDIRKAPLREAHRRLTGSAINYCGFVEGDDIFAGDVDVVVTDGFTGNVALKLLEGTSRALLGQVIAVRRQVRQAELDLVRRALARDVPTAEEVANLSRLRSRLEKPLRENPELDRLQERLQAVGLEAEKLYGLFPQP
jgi:hypothetical protein